MANDSDTPEKEVTDESAESGDAGGGSSSDTGDAAAAGDSEPPIGDRDTVAMPPAPQDPDVDALMAFVADAPEPPPPPAPPLPEAPPASAAPAPEPRPPLPTTPLDDASPFSEEIDIPPPNSVPVPRPMNTPTVWQKAIVEGVTPDSGPNIGGTGVTVHGEHLYRVSIVRFGGELAQTIGAREPSQVKVLVPATKRTGKVDISVQNPGAEETVVVGAFTYEALLPPKIDSIAPTYASAAGGTEISIIGKNFMADTRVLIGNDEATQVVFVDATTLEVVVPSGKSGVMMDVSVENPDQKRDTVKRAFKYG